MKFFAYKVIFQFIKYNIVGIVDAIIDISVFTFLVSKRVSPIWAQSASCFCGLVNGFFMNHYWTFNKGKKINRSEAIRFAIVNVSAVLITTGVMALSKLLLGTIEKAQITILGWPIYVVIGKISALIVGALFTFNANRLWVFSIQNTKNTRKVNTFDF